MGTPLKDSFGPDIPVLISDMVAEVHPDWDAEGFIAMALDGYEGLELTPRARHIAAALAHYLPEDPRESVPLLGRSLGPAEQKSELTGMAPFRYMPHVYYVAEHGLGAFEESMRFQYEVTQRFTAEFSIRAFLTRYPERTLARLREWASDPNVHVRRLVSEGTRPRLPWATRLAQFVAEPAPVLDLLDLLVDDPEQYVRRSVANNLNDISKDHPVLAIAVAQRWLGAPTADPVNRRRLVRHGLRTLIKQGDPGAMAVLGFDPDPGLDVTASVDPNPARIGESTRVRVQVGNPTGHPCRALVDLIVHFVKANGFTSPKVFKGRELRVEAGDRAEFGVRVSLRQHTTRTHHPGLHRVDVQVNGTVRPGAEFELLAPQ